MLYWLKKVNKVYNSFTKLQAIRWSKFLSSLYAICELGNVFWAVPARSQIGLPGKLVHVDLPPTVSQAALLRLEVLLFFDRQDPKNI